MKRNLFIVAAVTLMAMVSCNKDNIDNGGSQEPSYYVEFTANVLDEEPQLKTLYRETDRKTLWEADDAISVNGKKFQVKELYDEGLSAKFKNVDELGEFSTPYVAVSPYQDGHVVSGTTVSGVVLKAEQTATAASFESNAVVAMAYNADNNVLAFKNVCSIVKFKLGTASVKKVTITSNNGENLAGTLTIDYNNGEPKVTAVSNGTSTITLSGSFNTTDTYYVAVLASGLENGITVCLDGTVAKTVANELAFKRSIVMNAGTLSVTSTAQSVWTVVGGHNGWSTSTGTAMKKERGLLVAKNVAVTSEGFQFIKNKSWTGQVGNDGTTKNKWISANGSTSNITPGAGNYDLYLEENGKAYYIAPAGSPAPTAWSIVGIPNFDTDIVMYPQGEYLVAKNVKVSSSCTYKFRTYGRWDYSLSGVTKTFTQKKAIATESSNDNINISTGTYDIYLTGNAAFFFVVPAGHSLNDSDIVVNGRTLIGKLNGSDWDSDLDMYVCGDYFGRKGVVCGGEFKIRKDKSWDDDKVWGKGSSSGKLAQPGANIPATGTYDILVNHAFSNYYLK